MAKDWYCTSGQHEKCLGWMFASPLRGTEKATCKCPCHKEKKDA